MNKAEKLDKHRFLVQSKALTEEEFERINATPSAQRADEVIYLFFDPLSCFKYFFAFLFDSIIKYGKPQTKKKRKILN